MARSSGRINKQLPKAQEIRMDKISVYFKRPILKSIVKLLTMENGAYRTVKVVKNINRLFTNIDLSKYKSNAELESYIWCINYISKQWLEGVVSPELIAEGAKRQPEFDNIKGEIIDKCMQDENYVTAPEAKALTNLVSEALQYGYIASMKDEYIRLLEDINLDDPGAYKELTDRLFLISKSLMDIQHNTNMVNSKITFNTADISSVHEAIATTMDSLQSSNNMLKVGIQRLNTLLSPAYMNGRLYVYMGAPGSGKSVILLKSALDIRKYNPEFKAKTPGMKPCVLYVTMENTFTESIERVWNMTFDDSMLNYSVEEATEKICEELGISRIMGEAEVVIKDEHEEQSLMAQLEKEPSSKSNIEIVMKYFSYREISTDDLFTIIQDLREEENMEVCALVFDYIKRINPAQHQINDTVKAELSRIMNELKALAVICDIPVITAHQMNRAAAATMDQATRTGKGDAAKLVGRENVGDA